MADDIKISELNKWTRPGTFRCWKRSSTADRAASAGEWKSRRGPNKHKSSNPPMALDELEEAIRGRRHRHLGYQPLGHAAHPAARKATARPMGRDVRHDGRACRADLGKPVRQSWHRAVLIPTTTASTCSGCARRSPSNCRNSRPKVIATSWSIFVRQNRVSSWPTAVSNLPRNTGAIMSFNLWNVGTCRAPRCSCRSPT